MVLKPLLRLGITHQIVKEEIIHHMHLLLPKHRVGPDNYWLNQMTVPDGTAIFAGKELYIDNYRYAEVPRMTFVEKKLIDFYKVSEAQLAIGIGRLL